VSPSNRPRVLLKLNQITQVMTLIFTTIGSAADYGTFGRWLLFVVTLICWASQYAEISLTSKMSYHFLIDSG